MEIATFPMQKKRLPFLDKAGVNYKVLPDKKSLFGLTVTIEMATDASNMVSFQQALVEYGKSEVKFSFHDLQNTGDVYTDIND